MHCLAFKMSTLIQVKLYNVVQFFTLFIDVLNSIYICMDYFLINWKWSYTESMTSTVLHRLTSDLRVDCSNFNISQLLQFLLPCDFPLAGHGRSSCSCFWSSQPCWWHCKRLSTPRGKTFHSQVKRTGNKSFITQWLKFFLMSKMVNWHKECMEWGKHY